ncbi:MAG: anthranilate phosphoribosyltransferase [Acidobacteria bacterium]|nr:MAG: anthranilate phosphoribosyltransferase [Acidobacteriota bacterium]
MTGLLDRLLDGARLSEAEAAALLRRLADETTPPAVSGAVLAALRLRGVTAAELRGFARAMRELARRPAIARDGCADVVGTGGDGSGSLNLSTGTALLAAACGVPVVKHGNRSISSRCGSADVLEALGLPLPLDEEAAAACLEETGFTFLFAPHYHPAMRAIGPVRRALGVRTVFNILGPLTNPAAPAYHLIGAYDAKIARLMAEALSGLPIARGFVVHGAAGWDEPTPIGPFLLFDVRPGKVEERRVDPLDLGVARCAPADLAGGDARENAVRLRAALRGEEGGAHLDALVLGAGLVLELTGREPDLGAGMERARAAVADGAAARLLEAIADFGRRVA